MAPPPLLMPTSQPAGEGFTGTAVARARKLLCSGCARACARMQVRVCACVYVRVRVCARVCDAVLLQRTRPSSPPLVAHGCVVAVPKGHIMLVHACARVCECVRVPMGVRDRCVQDVWGGCLQQMLMTHPPPPWPHIWLKGGLTRPLLIHICCIWPA